MIKCIISIHIHREHLLGLRQHCVSLICPWAGQTVPLNVPNPTGWHCYSPPVHTCFIPCFSFVSYCLIVFFPEHSPDTWAYPRSLFCNVAVSFSVHTRDSRLWWIPQFTCCCGRWHALSLTAIVRIPWHPPWNIHHRSSRPIAMQFISSPAACEAGEKARGAP